MTGCGGFVSDVREESSGRRGDDSDSEGRFVPVYHSVYVQAFDEGESGDEGARSSSSRGSVVSEVHFGDSR